ncbi:OmpA family protein [Azospirillum sp. RWY-5-1]|uniref:OmpA family protein n=1 Tax=Azospirillum oleiclasticum TaxID=2735135 RepID=A0ABX2T6P2_9PROT|nr:OmpA family protein [Azospirillum oleiclasticum]NYZ12773.1 OmpA family protein [Azospirillum oleiclasticum]NYZ19933.1 OmpA family protein [Azospirillum oleiclasticum]
MAPRDSERGPGADGILAPPRRTVTIRAPSAGADDDQEIWLLSYSDLVTLLMSVFVMLLAITTIRDELPTTPRTPDPPAITRPGAASPAEAPTVEPAPLLDDDRPRLDDGEIAAPAPERLAERWLARLAALGVPPGVTVSVARNRVAITVGESILFATGRAELTQPGRDLLLRLAPALAAARGGIVVEGHTDVTAVTGGRYPSNWELSGARASGVVRRLIELGIEPQRLSAVGYADTRPLAPGSDPLSLARNRRVTLSIQTEE